MSDNDQSTKLLRERNSPCAHGDALHQAVLLLIEWMLSVHATSDTQGGIPSTANTFERKDIAKPPSDS